MEYQKLSKTYQVKKLNKTNVKQIEELCLKNPFFYRYCPPKPTPKSILEDMEKLPPNKTMKDKFYLGFFEDDTLIAIMDLILAYPNSTTAFIGFFMVNKEYQGRGIGSLIVQESFSYLSQEYKSIRLGYILGNPQSEAFWFKQGFIKTNVIIHEELYTIIVLEKKLEG